MRQLPFLSSSNQKVALWLNAALRKADVFMGQSPLVLDSSPSSTTSLESKKKKNTGGEEKVHTLRALVSVLLKKSCVLTKRRTEEHVTKVFVCIDQRLKSRFNSRTNIREKVHLV